MEKQTILEVDVDISKAVTAIQKYNEQLETVNKRLGELKEANQMNSKEAIELTAKKKLLNDQIRRNTTEVKNAIQQAQAQKGSLVSLRAEYNKLKQQYVEMSAEERKVAGEETLKRMQKLYNEISEIEQSYGVFSRNVGNYNNKIVGSLEEVEKSAESMGGRTEGLIKSVIGGVKNLDKSFTMLKANPFFFVLGAIVALFSALANAINKNEELSNRLSIVMAKMQPITNALANGIDKLAEGLVWVLENTGLVITKFAKFMDMLNPFSSLLKKFGFSFEDVANKVVKTLDTAESKEVQLQKRTIALEKEKREAKVKNAELDAEIADLESKFSTTDQKNIKKRTELFNKLQNAREKKAILNLDLAKKELKLEEEKAELAPNDREANEKLNDLKVAQINAQKELNRVDKQGQEQRNQIRTQQKTLDAERLKQEQQIAEEERKLQRELIEAQIAEYERLSKERSKVSQEVIKELDELYKHTEKAMSDRQRIELANAKLSGATEKELTDMKKQQELERLEATQSRLMLESAKLQFFYEQGKVTQEDYQEKSKELDLQYRENQIQQLEYKANTEKTIEERKTQALSDLQAGYDAMQKTSLGKTKAFAVAQKGIATAQIAVNAGKAIAEAVSSAADVPFPANLAAMAGAVAQVVALIASAYDTVSSAKFATGGLVGNQFSSRTDDSVNARLSVGESVMNSRSTAMYAPLLSALNQSQGGAPISAINAGASANNNNFLAEQFSLALRTMPNPVVSVQEFSEVSNRVQAIESSSAF